MNSYATATNCKRAKNCLFVAIAAAAPASFLNFKQKDLQLHLLKMVMFDCGPMVSAGGSCHFLFEIKECVASEVLFKKKHGGRDLIEMNH